MILVFHLWHSIGMQFSIKFNPCVLGGQRTCTNFSLMKVVRFVNFIFVIGDILVIKLLSESWSDFSFDHLI